jgi:hypothetical protein
LDEIILVISSFLPIFKLWLLPKSGLLVESYHGSDQESSWN